MGSASHMSEVSQLGDEPFVSLTTFRRNGEGVATPVWVARDGDALIVLTPAESHKVGRIRRDPHVRLAPSTRTGKLRTGGPLVDGTAAVITDSRASSGASTASNTGSSWPSNVSLPAARNRGSSSASRRPLNPEPGRG